MAQVLEVSGQFRRVFIRPVVVGDAAELAKATRASVGLHRPWVSLPLSTEAWKKSIRSRRLPTHVSIAVCVKETGSVAAVINLNEIVRGVFQSAYLGYQAFEPHAGHGLTREGMHCVLRFAFGRLKLHRVEANVQPDNLASIALVKSLGFRCEGYSPRYLKIAGRWRDHERWALLKEDWHPGRSRWSSATTSAS